MTFRRTSSGKFVDDGNGSFSISVPSARKPARFSCRFSPVSCRLGGCGSCIRAVRVPALSGLGQQLGQRQRDPGQHGEHAARSSAPKAVSADAKLDGDAKPGPLSRAAATSRATASKRGQDSQVQESPEASSSRPNQAARSIGFASRTATAGEQANPAPAASTP